MTLFIKTYLQLDVMTLVKVRSQVSLFLSQVENAKLFKEDLLRRNVKNSNALNL